MIFSQGYQLQKQSNSESLPSLILRPASYKCRSQSTRAKCKAVWIHCEMHFAGLFLVYPYGHAACVYTDSWNRLCCTFIPPLLKGAAQDLLNVGSCTLPFTADLQMKCEVQKASDMNAMRMCAVLCQLRVRYLMPCTLDLSRMMKIFAVALALYTTRAIISFA